MEKKESFLKRYWLIVLTGLIVAPPPYCLPLTATRRTWAFASPASCATSPAR